ncbi:heavy-metal-associated domain-containing protein [Curtobacterium ammoniigenes]|uniref:heavy-metal-associated domain-containing protein n=1 Tax=Curtobacterium ammoniigenes TaxID=395387 RepID=UPI00082F95E1|nr:heavy metal-associated domain-containing protein [Curtobacterium ammoniigenes]
MHETTYSVTGMTCEHCERRVASEITAIPGVSDATADASTGLVRVTSDAPLAEPDVRAAVEEAGYELADA